MDLAFLCGLAASGHGSAARNFLPDGAQYLSWYLYVWCAEILRLKAARQSGWLTEEEFNLELKRIIVHVSEHLKSLRALSWVALRDGIQLKRRIVTLEIFSGL